MEKYNKPSNISAYDAIFEAQKIALAPFSFHAAKSLLDLQILNYIEEAGELGISLEQLSRETKLSKYGISVLLDMGLSMGLVWYDKTKECFHLDKIGHFLLNDEMTRVNLNFSADVNYLGLRELTRSINESRPVGLSVFTESETSIYPFLSQLPKDAKKSWFEFDHFYSDNSFDDVLEELFKTQPKVIVDIGCNTGKWAKKVLEYNKDVRMILVDLPQQIIQAQKNIEEMGQLDRVQFISCDLLKEEIPTIENADYVFMSQFLDCFSNNQIVSLLKGVAKNIKNSKIAILEIFWDMQKHETASYVLNATSLYFTAMANGNSRFYSFHEFEGIISDANLSISTHKKHISIGGHSLLICNAM